MKKYLPEDKLNIFFLFILVLIIFISFSPPFNPIPERDSGVFLYMGQQINDGNLPYRDAWDHKGPVTYLFNSIGLLIRSQSYWGVWFVQLVLIWLASFLSYFGFKKLFGILPAFFSTAFWIAFLPGLIGGGNFVEVYGLLFQFFGLFQFIKFILRKNSRLDNFLLGVCASFSLLTRPNIIGIFLSIGLVIALWGITKKLMSQALTQILWIAMGAISILSITFGAFLYLGIFNDFWNAAFQYNFYYVGEGNISQIEFLIRVISTPNFQLLTGILLLGWFRSLHIVVAKRREPDLIFFFSVFLVLALPIEFYFGSLATNMYPHYFITWIPIIASLVAFLGAQVIENIPHFQYKNSHSFLTLLVLFPYFVSPSINFSEFVVLSIQNRSLPEVNVNSNVVEFVNDHPSQTVLFWGAETTFNFLTGRQSPTRFTYQYPFLNEQYFTQEMMDEFLDDLEENQPLIIDASSTNGKFRQWGLTTCGQIHPQPNLYLEEIICYIGEYYTITGVILLENGEWQVWEYEFPQVEP